jgi:uncharacterized protein YkwD
MIALMSLVLGAATLSVVETHAEPGDSNYEQMAQEVLRRVNEHRVAVGLNPLVMDSTLCAQARAYSDRMARGEIGFSHAGFHDRMQSIRDGMGYTVAGENLQRNNSRRDPIGEAMRGWLASEGHRTNMEFGYSKTGIGVARSADGVYYFTELFIQQDDVDVQLTFSRTGAR